MDHVPYIKNLGQYFDNELNRKAKDYLKDMEIFTSYICSLIYMNNPLCEKMFVIINSNKLRTYTTPRYYTDDEIIRAITRGKGI